MTVFVRTLSATAAIAAMTISPVSAESILGDPRETDGPYIGLSAGFLAITDAEGHVSGIDVTGEYDEGFAIGAQIGYKRSVLRAELEFEYGRSGTDSITFRNPVTEESASFGLNGNFDLFRATAGIYYDFDNLTRFAPFLGGGLGLVHVDFEEVILTDPGTGTSITWDGGSDTYFTAHGELGISIDVTDRFALVPAYRFIWINSGGNGFDDDTAHPFKLGTRFRF